jgi:ankyrin
MPERTSYRAGTREGYQNRGHDIRSLGALIHAAAREDSPSTERNRAFGEIVSRFQDMAFGAAYALLGDAHLAEDAAQEAFLTAWRHLDDLREPDAFPGWFQRIVRTQCSRLTRNKRHPTVSMDLVGDAPAGRSSDPFVRAARTERTAMVRAALAALPEHEREATLLYYLGDYGQAEIADFLGVPVTTVKKRVFSARKRLRERMAPYMEPENILRDELTAARPSNHTTFANTVRLRAAVEDGDTEAVSILLGESKALVNTTDSRGETPLHLASRCGHSTVAEALLKAGAIPNAKDNEGRTPLHALAEGAARSEIAEMLLTNGADLNATDSRGETPVGIAARRAALWAEETADAFAFAEYLLSKGARLDLHTAAALDRHAEIPDLVTRDPAAVNRPNADGDTPMHIAARAGYGKVAGALAQAGADRDARDASGRTPLQIAAQPGRTHRLSPRTAFIKGAVEWGKATVDVFTAALLGDTARLSEILTDDATAVHTRDAEGATPLHHAAWQGHADTVSLLLAKGADPKATDNHGRTPLSVRWSAADFDESVADRLTAAGGRLDLRGALALGRAEDAKTMLAADPALATPELLDWSLANLTDPALILLPFADSSTLTLHQATSLGANDVVTKLLEADPEAIRTRDEKRETALHRAAYHGHTETVRLLLDRGASVHATADDGGTPLHRAVASGHRADRETAYLLLDRGADAGRTNHRGETPLFAACAVGDTELAERLIHAGASVNSVAAGKVTPLHIAAEKGHTTLTQRLLAQGANPNAANYWNGTPLHLAAREGHTEVARALLAGKAELLARDNWYRTPLHAAVWFGQREVAELLLDAGIPVSELSYGFSTPLHVAAEKGHVDVADLLTARGADVNARSDFGRTPLHDAVNSGHPEMVSFLLTHGADPTSPNNRSMTPLHWAAAAGKTEIVRLLVEAGADKTVRSHKNETPFDLAMRYKQTGIAELLR